jgi:hypothetical protein
MAATERMSRGTLAKDCGGHGRIISNFITAASMPPGLWMPGI